MSKTQPQPEHRWELCPRSFTAFHQTLLKQELATSCHSYHGHSWCGLMTYTWLFANLLLVIRYWGRRCVGCSLDQTGMWTRCIVISLFPSFLFFLSQAKSISSTSSISLCSIQPDWSPWSSAETLAADGRSLWRALISHWESGSFTDAFVICSREQTTWSAQFAFLYSKRLILFQ